MGRGARALEPEALLPFFETLDCQGTIHIAFSGGVDSTALLLALHELRDRLSAPLQALHVNHGAHPDADQWARHCERLCERLEVPLTISDPPNPPLASDNPEARLRAWRLEVFEAVLSETDVVCTAHHQQDQAETLLLALLRGSGVRGLSAMPALRPLPTGRLARPLLDWSRAALAAFVADRQVRVIDDPGNLDERMDRNFIRHQLMPLLETRWPAAESSLAKSAALLARSERLIETQGALALAGRLPQQRVLRLIGLEAEPDALAELIRLWLRTVGTAPLPGKQLEELLKQLREAKADQLLECCWNGHRLLHGSGLLWLDPLTDITLPAALRWNGQQTLQLGPEAGQLRFTRALPVFDGELRGRTGGERLRRGTDRGSEPLKRWFAAHALPAWYRSAVPLLYSKDRLLAIGDVTVDRAFQDTLKEHESALRWEPGDAQLRWAWEECRRGGLRVK